jgi:hypothetical protein
MVRTFQEKWRSGPGFRTHHLFTMAFDPQLVRFTEAQTERFYKDLVRRARMLPGVKSAALTGELPMSNDQDGVSVIPEGYQMPTGKESFPVDMDVAGQGYFSTLGVQLVRGRGFHETDTVTSPKVAVVNEQFAKHYWPNSDARVLALAGLYGVVTYSANRRTREIGIRMAVGADAKAVLRMVPRQAVLLVIGSMGIGLVLAAAAEKGLHAIFARSGTDLGAYVLILPALVAVTMVAAFIPARRVSRIEPTRAWRYE